MTGPRPSSDLAEGCLRGPVSGAVYPDRTMSGHSKWSTIKRKKGAQDAKRSQVFAKLLRAVEVAAREGGPSVEGNMTLAAAVEKARSNSVPWDTIDRAIKRAAGEGDG